MTNYELLMIVLTFIEIVVMLIIAMMNKNIKK